MSGWDSVGKEGGKRGSLAGRFVQFEDGVSVVMRILDDEPHTTRVHKITQVVTKGDKKEEVFRSIPATENPDDNYILKTNGKRYPDAMQHCLRAHVYGKDEKTKKLTLEGEKKILQGGPAIFKPLKALYEQFGSLSGFDIVITRNGKGRDSEYTVSASPMSQKVDIDALRAELQADETLNDWANIFTPVTGEQQKAMCDQAGFNIAHDPVADIVAVMSVDEAKSLVFPFGKFKGKKVGELAIIDAGYLAWAADNVTSNDAVAAACRVLVKDMAALSAGESATPAALPPAKATAKADAKPAAAPKDAKERETLLEQVNSVFEQDGRYEDLEVMVNVIKKHGGGKTKVKDLTVPQLRALHAEISGS